MTQEEKAGAYDAALKVIKKCVPDENGFITIYPQEIFPELKETESSKIRKFISNELACLRALDEKGSIRYEELTNAIAWLEKQDKQDMIPLDKVIKFLDDQLVNDKDKVTGESFINFRNYGSFKETFISYFKRKMLEKQDEHQHLSDNFPSFDESQGTIIVKKQGRQNPTDKIEPAFKVGNWIVDSLGNTLHIISVEYDYYVVENPDARAFDFDRASADLSCHLWTIKDAKEGDVIFYDSGWTCIFKNIHGIWYSSYCFITADGKFYTGYEEHAVDSKINGNANPATKEQYAFFFQKIHEAGYEWDSEHFELKLIQ